MTACTYASFLAHKAGIGGDRGFDPTWLPEALYPFQADLTTWAIRKGSVGLFADCGLGKTAMQLAWGENVLRHSGRPVLLVAPLGVTFQVEGEAAKFGVEARVSRDGKVAAGVTVTNYDRLHLFNGQQANVIDSAFRPFVISVIPVVGEFAAAQQPVIVVLSEGTMMTVQAVVSDDRRYVRLTLVPFFSQIGDVETFTFEGSESISTSSASTDTNDGENDTSEEETEERSRSGTTVQLPTFQVITVSTTVSVPDGGTVLLGGIKRLAEARNEFGVPLLSKVPYIDRLFRNVGIGRETESLMMMVTPHIIIQEEEEDRLGVAAAE